MELDPGHLSDAVNEARRWFSVKKGVEKSTILALLPGQAEYDLPDDCDAVIDCSVQTGLLDIAQVFQPNLLAGELVPYDIFASSAATGGFYSSLVQIMQSNETARRVIGAEFNWLIRPDRKIIFSGSRWGAAHVFVEYKAPVGNIEQLSERDHDLIKRYALAWARHMLGTIRSKYDSVPGAQGPARMDGPELKAEAKEDIERLNEEIINTAMPMPIVTG